MLRDAGHLNRPAADGRVQPTQVAYADETSYNIGRFRGIGLVTASRDDALALTEELRRLLQHSDVGEFKWEKLRACE